MARTKNVDVQKVQKILEMTKYLIIVIENADFSA